MNEKKVVTFLIRDNFTEISTNALKLCELFAIKVLEAKDLVIEIKVDEKNKLLTSSTHSIKDIFAMYFKSGQIDSFYNQLIALDSSNLKSDEIKLKLLGDGKMLIIRIREVSALPNLHLRIVQGELEQS